jgi:hypothetical protein
MNVNYIKHIQAFVARIELDERLSPWHISLYYALFHCWNDNQRTNPISINRQEVMSLSKIGSFNTYTKALKQLHEWGYIIYEPSNNRWLGSKVYMYRFDNGSDNSTDNTTDKGSDNTAVREVVKEVRPSLKSIKNKKITKYIKIENKSKFVPPSMHEVINFFLDSNSTKSESEKFFNHFESNGWLVGGKAKMKNWQAAARNWIKRSLEFKSLSADRNGTSSTQARSPGNLNVNQNKDYSIPL